MRWSGRRESDNVEDIRGQGGGMRGAPLAMGGGLGTLIIILIMLFLGVDPRALINMQQGGGGGGPIVIGEGAEQVGPIDPDQEELKKFVSVVLADTEDVWKVLLRQQGMVYEEPKLVLFSGAVRSACGLADSAVGPFYCPGDHKVYVDLSFLQEMGHRFGADGDFAQAYVVAHEVGHHIQNLLGTMDKVNRLRSRISQEEYNEYSVRLELQADFYAGVWAHHAQRMKNILERGDIEEAIDAAAAVGDDRLQKRSQGYVVPESFTHGTAAQRARWFKKGFETGDIRQGDTFGANDL